MDIMTWCEEIVCVLKALGGKATLAEIYDFIKQTKEDLQGDWRATIRQTIGDNSSDGSYRTGKNLFYSVEGKGSGIWGLREWLEKNIEVKSVNPTEFIEEIENGNLYEEGTKKLREVITYDRNKDARKKCLEHYGIKCAICGFDFYKVYGEVGKGFIHVHHLKPLSEIGDEYQLDPIKDLRPVCPNCHGIIHRRNPPYCLKEMENILDKKEWLE